VDTVSHKEHKAEGFVQETPDVEAGWDGLADRIEQLSVFMIEFNNSDMHANDRIQKILDRLKS